MSSDDPESLCVYCAGPLFNQSERDEMTAIAEVLCAAGYRVFLPHRDGMEFRLVHRVLIERGVPAAEAAALLHAAIFALDVYQVAACCDALVWNLNGRTPDEGAVCEAAIAWTLGKPVLAFRDDVRTLIAGRLNPLVAGLVDFETVQTVEEIPAALDDVVRRAKHRRVAVQDLPDNLARAVTEGEMLWQAMNGPATKRTEGELAELVIELFRDGSCISSL